MALKGIELQEQQKEKLKHRSYFYKVAQMQKPFSGYQVPIIFFAVSSPALRKFKAKMGDESLEEIC